MLRNLILACALIFIACSFAFAADDVIEFQAKGCGIIGVEAEPKYDEKTLNAARKFLQAEGVTYPNVLMPEDVKVFQEVMGYPTSFFVDNNGKILGEPIIGAQVNKYEPALDALLAKLDN